MAAGHPTEELGRGSSPSLQQRKREGVAPLSGHAQGAPGGPLVASDRRQAAGGAESGGGSGHPKEEREKGELGLEMKGFVEMVEMSLVVDLRWRRRNWEVWEEEEM